MNKRGRRNKRKAICNTISKICMVFSVVFMLWFAFSVVEVWIHNDAAMMSVTHTYSDFNLFTLMVEHFSR